MDVFVPFSTDRPKSRLSGTLTPSERDSFVHAMLADVLAAVTAAGGHPHVLATSALDRKQVPAAVAASVPVTVDTRPLTAAVDEVLPATSEEPAVAVVMSDLALATPRSLREFFGSDADVTIAPGRGAGTNALVVDNPAFTVDYHGASYRDHLEIARSIGASVREIDSHRLATDVDERADLTEVLLHGDGAARDWLVDAGFELSADEGRVGVARRAVESPDHD